MGGHFSACNINFKPASRSNEQSFSLFTTVRDELKSCQEFVCFLLERFVAKPRLSNSNEMQKKFACENFLEEFLEMLIRWGCSRSFEFHARWVMRVVGLGPCKWIQRKTVGSGGRKYGLRSFTNNIGNNTNTIRI